MTAFQFVYFITPVKLSSLFDKYYLNANTEFSWFFLNSPNERGPVVWFGGEAGALVVECSFILLSNDYKISVILNFSNIPFHVLQLY